MKTYWGKSMPFDECTALALSFWNVRYATFRG